MTYKSKKTKSEPVGFRNKLKVHLGILEEMKKRKGEERLAMQQLGGVELSMSELRESQYDMLKNAICFAIT